MTSGGDLKHVRLREQGKVKTLEKEAKSILNRRKQVNEWLWDRYTVNPYEGCAQACEYCDSVSHRYHRHADFHRTVYAKVNAPVVLRRQARRRPPDVVVLSSATEPYQSAEARYRLTHKCLEVLLELGFPVHIVTKSPLVTTDTDLLKAIHTHCDLRVSFTILTLRDRPCRALEPRSPSAIRRLEALESLASEGICVGVLMIPLVPFFVDSRDNVEEVVSAAKDAGASYLLAGGLTLRDRQEERWYDFLRDQYPEMAGRFRLLPDDHSTNAARVVSEVCRSRGIAERVPRLIAPNDPLSTNKRVAEQLYRMCYELQMQGARPQRAWAWRRAAWAVDDLRDDIRHLRGDRQLESIPAVGPRIASQIETVLDGLGED
jgi:DNA repair photolyase